MTSYTTHATVFGEQSGSTDEPIAVTFEYCADFTGDGYDDIRVTLDLTAFDPPNSGTEDMIGVAFDIAGNATSGLSITDIVRSTYFGALSTSTPTVVIGADQVSDGGPLDPGFNTSGGGTDEPYDIGVKFSDPGSGEGIVQKASFVITGGSADLDAEALLEGTDWWVRLQSTDGGEGSAKTAGFVLDLPECEDDGAAAIQIRKDMVCADDGDDGEVLEDGAYLLAGSDITWRYTVTNPGDAALANIAVVDDNGTPLDDDDDFQPAYVSGDDGDGLLQNGESWIFEQSGIVTAGDYGNTATASSDHDDDTVTAAITDGDDASYFGVTMDIGIEKYVWGYDADSQTYAWLDADTAGAASQVPEGANVWFLAGVTVDSNIPVSGDDIVLTDQSLSGDAALSFGTLDENNDTWNDGDTNLDGFVDIGETWYYKAETTAPEIGAGTGDHGDRLTAAVDYTDDCGNTPDPASDDAWFHAEGPGVRTPGFWKNWADFWDGDASVPKQAGTPGFVDADLTDTGNAYDGKLVFTGDNLNTVAVESIEVVLTQTQALSILSASAKTDAKDARYMLGRDVIATHLNDLAGNDIPQEEYEEGVDWLITFGFPGISGAKVVPSSSAWQDEVGLNDFSAAELHSRLDAYNNTGAAGGVQYAGDSDYFGTLPNYQYDTLIFG